MMKRIFFLLSFLAFWIPELPAQVSINLSGYPIVTTGWSMGGTAFVVDSEIELTTSGPSESGYINFSTSENVTACGQFTADFDYKISSPGGCGNADGITFFFINPLTSFVAGGGLGLPNPLTGFVLTMDTWDNDGDGLNPEDELFGFATPSTYSEGDYAQLIAPILGHQSYMDDGSWHHVHLTYNGGTIRVYVNGATTPSMTGTFPITSSGYFGFTAGTGCGYNVQMIKSVHIVSNTISPILGVTTVCQGSTTTLYDSTSGGSWTSSNTAVATVGSSNGVVTGITTGTAVITYTYNTGACFATTTVNVVTPPGIITGAGTMCQGATATFTDPTGGGSWSSSAPTIATVGSATGLVTAVSAGTATITYSTGGTCYVLAVVTVDPVPTPITGSSTVCAGFNATMGDGLPGGVWSSSSLPVATVGSTSGVLAALTPGTVTVTYTAAICPVSKVVTVNPSPVAITGASHVCVGYTTTLADATTGGTWSASSGAATVSSSGVVTGITAGVLTITYTIPDGCYVTYPFTVNPLPSAIAGASAVCVGATNVLFSPGAGTWSSSSPAIATVGLTTGIATGVSAGPVTITYTLPTGCYTTYPLTVNLTPAPIAGSLNDCIGAPDTLTDVTPGGIWFSSDPLVATIDPAYGTVTGLVADTLTMLYTLGSCSATAVVTVNPLPDSIIGTNSFCLGGTTFLFDATVPGSWSSGNAAIATIGALSGVLTGVSPGVDTVYYVNALTGCAMPLVVSVNALPSAIVGVSSLCVGLSGLETDSTAGGTWTSSNPAIGSIAATGMLTGRLAGTITLTYTAPDGCVAVKPVTINSSPGVIGGTLSACAGSTTLLTDVGSGTWFISAGSAGVATIGTASGLVSGVGAGMATVTYSLGAGCNTTAILTINPLPSPIGGPGRVCVGSCITVTDAGGGRWSTVGTAATVGSATGSVCGITAGLENITYTLPVTGCVRTTVVTVNPSPALFPVMGGGSYCAGGTGVHITLGGSSAGVNYQLYNGPAAVGAPIAGTGGSLDFGLQTAAGTYTITGTLVSTSCTATMSGSAVISINPLPTPYLVTGGGAYCAGGAGVPIGLAGSATGVLYQLMIGAVDAGAPVPGTGLPLSFGNQTLSGTYTVVATNASTGCVATMTGTRVVTVNPVPMPISGPSALCPGATITLSDATPGGTWSSTPVTICPVDLHTGVVTGVSTGAGTVTYTLLTGCFTVVTINVSPAPGPIAGPGQVCVGATASLSDGVAGGIWSSSSVVNAVVGSLSGIVTGVATGTTNITYSLGSSCYVTRIMSVNPASPPISGLHSVCTSSTISLTYGGTSPSWGSSDPTVATVSAAGTVSGISPGVVVISCPVAVGAGCPTAFVVTVNPTPVPIAAASVLCAGSSLIAMDGSAGGAWSATGAITVTATGLVTGIAAGTGTLNYSLGTCMVSKNVTVNPLAVVSGASGICAGSGTTLGVAGPAGSWGIINPALATISTAGVLNGLAAGVDTVLYTLTTTGCITRYPVTVDPLPALIGGAGSICAGVGATLTDAVPGGAWSSLSPSVATVGSATGTVTGVSAGTAAIVYSEGGCATSVTETVIATPAPISGARLVCTGDTVTETDALAGGYWTSGDSLIASVGPSGQVTGISSGTTVITYALSSGCETVAPIVVNPVSPISGTNVLCAGTSAPLTDTTIGGTWSSSNIAIARISASGIWMGVAAGTAVLYYHLPTGCSASWPVTVNPVPGSLSGLPAICAADSALLICAAPVSGGVWSSSNPSVATVATTGMVTGLTAGVAIISYTNPLGCASIHSITVNPVPAVIAGAGAICLGGSVVCTDATGGGLWSSSSPVVATAGSASGAVTGTGMGVTTIRYTMPTGCGATAGVTVNAAVPAISGTLILCAGSADTLTDAATGGVWSSASAGVAVVDAALGVVTAISPGTTTITYATGAGCAATVVVTVHAAPAAIAGTPNLCQGSSHLFADSSPAGTWSSSAPAIAAFSGTPGLLSGILAGSAIITYSLGTGCYVVYPVVVQLSPAGITGVATVCPGLTTTLADSVTGGTWASSNPSVASVDPGTGIVTGVVFGSATISYTLTDGCQVTEMVTVDPFPAPIAGPAAVCQGVPATYTDSITGGGWTSSDPAIATIGVSSGTLGALLPGVTTLTYSIGIGCNVSTIITVNPLPAPIAGPTGVCATQSITLTDATAGGTWTESPAATAVIDAGGTLTGLAAGVATVSYNNGCGVSYEVTVNTMPSHIAGNPYVCIGGTSDLRDTVAGGTWISANPAVAAVGSATGVVFGASLGSTTIIYTLADGCMVSEAVHVAPLPTVYAVTGGGNYCAGGAGVPVGLSGSAVGINYFLYRGVTATGSFAGSGSALAFGAQTVAGLYNVLATDVATGCSMAMSGSATIVVNPSVLPVVSIHATPVDSICSGTTTNFNITSVNSGSTPAFQWFINNVNVSSANNYSFIPANGDWVKVMMSSTANCAEPATVSDSVRMTVNPYGNPLVHISTIPGDTVCAGTEVVLHAIGALAGPSPVYYWFKNGAPAGSGPDYTFGPTAFDEVNCVLVSDYPCRLANTDTSAYEVFTIDTGVTPQVAISVSPGTIVGQGTPVTFTATVAHGGSSPSYQWVVNGIPVTGATNAAYTSSTFSGVGYDSVSCQVTSSGYCPQTGIQWVYLQVAPVRVVNQALQGAMHIVPNPASGSFRIYGTVASREVKQLNLTLTDVAGQVVSRRDIPVTNGTFDTEVSVENLASGVYFVSAGAGTFLSRLVVEH